MIVRLSLWLLLLPLQLALLAVFALTDALRGLTLPFRGRRRAAGGAGHGSRMPPASEVQAATLPNCTIVVLNWNGRQLLAESLPALRRAVDASRGAHEILVVDNGSDDGSADWVRQNHPEARVLELPENLGFGEGNNRGVQAAAHDVVVLLNNDMVVEEGFLNPLLECFADPDVFAAAAQIFFPEGKRREETGLTGARWRRGYLHLAHREVGAAALKRGHVPVLWAGGGASAYHRRRFLDLGGFDPLFSPCYLEDTDLSYRAWRRGWKSVFIPAARALHKHRSSSGKRFDPRALASMIERRKLWYVWKNYQLQTLADHFIKLPLNFGSFLRAGDFMAALLKLPRVLAARFGEPRRAAGDRLLFSWVDHPALYLNHFDPQRAARGRAPGSPLRILVCSAYLPHLGRHGGAGRVFQLMRRVAERHHVSLISFVETDEEHAETAQAAPFCRRIETVFRRRFDPLSFFPYEPFEEFNSPDFRKRLLDLLAEEDFDLVHFEWTQMALHAGLFPTVPKLITEIEVNYAAHHSLVGVESNPLRKVRLLYNALQTMRREVQLCERVDRVVCVTDADRDFLAGYVDRDKLEVVNTGVDTGYFRPGPLEKIDPDALVYVGAFRHEPNVDAMRFFCRDVFPLILGERPRTRLYIVGSSPPREIRDLGRRPEITVTGFVPDIREYYDLAQVVVVPLRTGVGIRGKILEGWSAAKAMVATPLACLGIDAVHGENIFIAQDAKNFARWTLALLDHPGHCREIGIRGRKLAEEKYEWDQLGAEMAGVYESFFQDRPGHTKPDSPPEPAEDLVAPR